MTPLLQRLDAAALTGSPAAEIPARVLERVREIVTGVRDGGDRALVQFVEELDGRPAGSPLLYGPTDLARARDATDPATRALLERTAARIDAFARAQRAALVDVDVPVPGGRAGHRVIPLETAGCYAPGGRHPLPSSVLMTAVTARAAGVDRVIVACPRPEPVILAAAAVAGADGLLAAGGAQAVAALAYGTESVPACDAVVGPGNVWVTAAKSLVADRVRTDGVAGPSELVVVADAACDPARVAADLFAQAEHDPLARVVLISLDPALPDAVDAELVRLLETLPTAPVARESLAAGAAVLVPDVAAAVALCNRLAPEHLQWSASAEAPSSLRHYGGLFLGRDAAEVLGDYGAGPNHVLPTAGQARLRGGLSVYDFSKTVTWLRIEEPGRLAADAAELARIEGLAGHARAASLRSP